MACLRNSYSTETYPVPSAGGLYPLRIYSIQKSASSRIPEGLYQYNHTNDNLIQIEETVEENDLGYIFSSEDLLHKAPSIIVIAADMKRHGEKYANRGYRYTLLEAGHSAQNIHLTASELGLSTLEFGGFRDKDLAESLKMPIGYRPLITIALGYQAKAATKNVTLDVDLLRGPGKPVEWSYVDFTSPASKLLRFYRSVAKFQKPNRVYNDEENLFASGTSASPQLAEIKAVAEAYERYVAGQVEYDIFEAAVNIHDRWLSPNEVRPMSDEQLKQTPYVEKFDQSKPIHWKRGNYIDGNMVYVPIDLIFYPIDTERIGRLLVAESDSSGMAAHTDYNEAAKGGLLELIERDAIMKTWMTKNPPDRIDTGSLPQYYQKRAEFWDKIGKVFDVLDFSHDDVAIAGVVIRSKDATGYPYMVNGASASTDSFEKALKKASQEAELGAAEYVTAERKTRKLAPSQVFSPADHANFYAHGDYGSEIEWLWNGETKAMPDKISNKKDLLKTFNPIIIKLTPNESPLQVVRVIAPNLVPISFGFGKELYLHPSTKLQYYKKPVSPHFFA